MPLVGLVGKEFTEEEGFGGFIMAEGAFFSLPIHSLVGCATAEAAAEGAGIFAPVLDVGVGVNREVVVRRGGLVSLED